MRIYCFKECINVLVFSCVSINQLTWIVCQSGVPWLTCDLPQTHGVCVLIGLYVSELCAMAGDILIIDHTYFDSHKLVLLSCMYVLVHRCPSTSLRQQEY